MLPDAPLSPFLGVWQANQFMPNGDRCNIRLEIRQAVSNPVTQATMDSGFDTRTCLSSDLFKAGGTGGANIEQLRKDTSPVSTSMMGRFEDDSKVPRKEGETWMLRYRLTSAEGRRVENTLPVGLVRDLPNERAAWHEVDKRGLLIRINEAPTPGRIRFRFLAEHYLTADFGEDAMRPKTEGTTANTTQIVRVHLIPRWGDAIAEDIKPLDIQRWLKALHRENGLAWTTISKIRGVMLRIYKIGILHELVAKNPVEPVESRSKSDYRAITLTPVQTRAILKALTCPLHRILVLTCAATALRASELLALRCADIRYAEERIRVSKRWSRGKDGATKTKGSDGYVPLHPCLARHLKAWHTRTPYAKDTDFVFPSLRRMDAFRSPRPYSLPITCARCRLPQVFRSPKDIDTASTISGIPSPTGW